MVGILIAEPVGGCNSLPTGPTKSNRGGEIMSENEEELLKSDDHASQHDEKG